MDPTPQNLAKTPPTSASGSQAPPTWAKCNEGLSLSTGSTTLTIPVLRQRICIAKVWVPPVLVESNVACQSPQAPPTNPIATKDLDRIAEIQKHRKWFEELVKLQKDRVMVDVGKLEVRRATLVSDPEIRHLDKAINDIEGMLDELKDGQRKTMRCLDSEIAYIIISSMGRNHPELARELNRFGIPNPSNSIAPPLSTTEDDTVKRLQERIEKMDVLKDPKEIEMLAKRIGSVRVAPSTLKATPEAPPTFFDFKFAGEPEVPRNKAPPTLYTEPLKIKFKSFGSSNPPTSTQQTAPWPAGPSTEPQLKFNLPNYQSTRTVELDLEQAQKEILELKKEREQMDSEFFEDLTEKNSEILKMMDENYKMELEIREKDRQISQLQEDFEDQKKSLDSKILEILVLRKSIREGVESRAPKSQDEAQREFDRKALHKIIDGRKIRYLGSEKSKKLHLTYSTDIKNLAKKHPTLDYNDIHKMWRYSTQGEPIEKKHSLEDEEWVDAPTMEFDSDFRSPIPDDEDSILEIKSSKSDSEDSFSNLGDSDLDDYLSN